MNRTFSIVLMCAFGVAAGCAHNGKHGPTTRHSQMASASAWASDEASASNEASSEPSTSSESSNATASDNQTAAALAQTISPAVATENLAGAWSLAAPRKAQQQATITATDENHVTIQAGDNLSGEYIVQGQYLLVLTRDEKLRPLAWKINSPDSITVVRSPEIGDGVNYTGVTLVRAPEANESASTQENTAGN